MSSAGPGLGAGLLAAVVIQIYLNSTIADWWSSASYGQRRLCSVTLPLVVGNAALLTRLARARLRWLQHAAVVLVFGGFVVANLTRVWRLRAGRPAPSELTPTCCRDMPGFVQGIYDHLGNPFELPASALFAIRHGVSLRRWDRIVGEYPLTPPFGAYRDDTLHRIRTSWTPRDEFLVGDWSPMQPDDRPHRTTSNGRVLVPILIPQPTTLAVWVKGVATIEWDGDEIGHATGDTWVRVAATVEPSAGTHELAIDGARVAVGQIEMELQ